MKKANSVLDQRLSEIPPAERRWHRMMDDVAARIMDLMDQQGLTQEALALRMGKHKSYINRVISGGVNLTLKTIAEFEAALGASVVNVLPPETVEAPRRRQRGSEAAPGDKASEFAAAMQNEPVTRVIVQYLKQLMTAKDPQSEIETGRHTVQWFSGAPEESVEIRQYLPYSRRSSARFVSREILVASSEDVAGGVRIRAERTGSSSNLDSGPQDSTLRRLGGFPILED